MDEEARRDALYALELTQQKRLGMLAKESIKQKWSKEDWLRRREDMLRHYDELRDEIWQQ